MPHQCTNCLRTFPDGSKEMLSGCPDCGGNKFQFAPKSTPDTETASGMDGAQGHPGPVKQQGVSPDFDPESKTGTDQSSDPASTTDNRSWPESAKPSMDSHDNEKPEVHREWPDVSRPPTVEADDERESGETVRDPVAPSNTERDTDTPPSGDPIETTPIIDGDDPEHTPTASEDVAQASARSDVIRSDELPMRSETEPSRSITDSSAASDRSARNDDTPDTDSSIAVDNSNPADSTDESLEQSVTIDESAPPAEGRIADTPSTEKPSLDDLREELNEQFESIKIVRPGEYELNLMELYDREEYIVSLQEDGRYVIDVPDSWMDD